MLIFDSLEEIGEKRYESDPLDKWIVKNRNKESRKHLGNHDFLIMIAISSKVATK